MKVKGQHRFDVGALRKLAGEKVFARGEDYFSEGQVQVLFVEPRRVVAQVVGTETYRTVLKGAGKAIDGDCSCPAFEDWGFCKHMVALALAVNDMGFDAGKSDRVLARIRDHLKEKDPDVLVDMIVGLAERDPALFHKLKRAAVRYGGKISRTP